MKLLLTILLLTAYQIAYSQKNEKSDLVSVLGFVGGPHPSAFSKNCRDTTYTAIGVVRNNQDTTISFFIMAKSWYIDNWITDNENIIRDFEGWSLNYEQEIRLMPQQSIQFSFELVVRNKIPINNSFKLGFVFSQRRHSLREIPLEERIKKEKIYWSNNLTLESNTLYHKIM